MTSKNYFSKYSEGNRTFGELFRGVAEERTFVGAALEAVTVRRTFGELFRGGAAERDPLDKLFRGS